ncbi:Uncharacterised protein [uncultured archaeon]|nr:Uncharacterised protein [uncultured archaeon]
MYKKDDELIESEISSTITTQEQESIVVQEKKVRTLNSMIVGWNVLLYFMSVFLIFLGIQHATIFYQWPPDISKWVEVPVYLYFLLGAFVFVLLKTSHYIEEQGTIFVDTPPAEELADQEVP